MQLKYWADKALEENRDTSETPVVPEVNEINNTEIVYFEEKLREKQEEEYEQKEIDEFFEKEEKKASKGSIAKYIFVDGLLGIPFLTICYLIISSFVALFFVMAVAFLAASVGLIAISPLMFSIGFGIIAARTASGLATVAAAVLTIAAGLVFLLLATLFGLRIMPWTAKLAVKLENKLHLFRA